MTRCHTHSCAFSIEIWQGMSYAPAVVLYRSVVFLVVVSLAVLSYYAENDKAYSTAQLPSTQTDGTSSSS